MNERESFIRDAAMRLMVAAVSDPTRKRHGDERVAMASAAAATALADALGIPATTTPRDCYAIPKAVGDVWVAGARRDTHEYEQPLLDAILAQRKESK